MADSSVETSRALSNSVSKPLPLRINSSIDSSGLAERALANAWFYKGEAERGAEYMERMIGSATNGSPARLAHALYMRSVSFTSLGDNVKGAQFAAATPVSLPPMLDRPPPWPKPSTPRASP